MKIRISMENPDCVYEAVKDAAEADVSQIEGMAEDERNDLVESRQEGIFEILEKWIEYKEYITVEFDTEAMTAIVVPRL